MTTITRKFKVKIFADGAEKEKMLAAAKDPMISGFTTNPTLMKKGGVTDYKQFAQEIIAAIPDKSLSFEVFADEFDEMEKQAREIASWGGDVYIKIPITNTKNESSFDLVKTLSDAGIKTNVTAMMTVEQVESVLPALENSPGAYVSVFAGRIGDTGIDPLPTMKKVVEMLKAYPKVELIWASPREVLNVVQADEIGCQIITITDSMYKKLSTVGKDLDQFSLETVKMFYKDATEAGFKI
jgi:transaldolase